jgi:HD-GYP domain-containing protein (c-di-GMP phosphodiesterase class II)
MYDALVSERPYRKAMSKEEAIRLLREDARAGRLDRSIVETLIDLLGGQLPQTSCK